MGRNTVDATQNQDTTPQEVYPARGHGITVPNCIVGYIPLTSQILLSLLPRAFSLVSLRKS